MIVRRIKPRITGGGRGGRAGGAVRYITTKAGPANETLLAEEIEALKRHGGAEGAPLLDALQARRGSEARASALVTYAAEASTTAKATWAVVANVPGWVADGGDTFYAGVGSPSTAAAEFERFAGSAKRGGHPIEHLVVSWPEHERPSAEVMISATNQVLETAGLPLDCPRVLAVHRDTDNLHVHAVVSRYRPAIDRVWSAPRWIDQLHRAAREVELSYGFTHDNGNHVVAGSLDSPVIIRREFAPAVLSPAAAQFEAHMQQPSFEAYIRSVRKEIDQVIEDSSTWNDVHRLLAARLGIGVRRHGRGLVATCLTDAGEQAVKGSTAGLGAPKLEAIFGPWRQVGTANGLRALQMLAEHAPLGYRLPRNTSAAVTGVLDQQRRDVRRKIREVAVDRRQDARSRWQAELNEAIRPIKTGKERAKIRREFQQRWRDEAAELERAEKAARQAANSAYRTRRRSPAQLAELLPALRPSSLCVLGVRVNLLMLELPGMRAIAVNDGVQYLRGGDPLLMDTGDRVEIFSEAGADIEDGLKVLLATRGEAEERGVTVSGTPEFRCQAVKVLARAGVPLANPDPSLQRLYEIEARDVLNEHSMLTQKMGHRLR